MRLVSIPIVQTQPSFLFRFGLCFPFALTAFRVDAFPCILPAFWVDAFPCILPAPRVELEAKIPLIDRVMPSRSFQTTVPKHVLEVWRKTIGRRNQINYCHIIELKSIRG